MPTKKHKMQRVSLRAVLCLFVAFSFVSILLPIAVSANRSTEMPCCAGKAGHCDSGLHANATKDDDGITIVAQPSQSSSAKGNTVKPASLSHPCPMECGVCTASSSRQQKRERAIAQALPDDASPSHAISHREDLPGFFSPNDEWPRIIPRGPPASSLR